MIYVAILTEWHPIAVGVPVVIGPSPLAESLRLRVRVRVAVAVAD